MIGFFDSGSGGLSVLSALRARAPRADIAYFGDIKNAPYGIRSPEELAALTVAGVETLKGMGATEIVSACNSISASVLAGAAGETPVVEMTKPTARGMRAHQGKRILLIATPATVNSKIYEEALGSFVEVESLAITELAGTIEFGGSDAKIAQIVREALETRGGKTYDYLLLGCTHYPLVQPVIEAVARGEFGDIQCIDPAEFVAEEAVRTFDCEGSGQLRFRISKESGQFRARVRGLFGESGYTIDVI